MAPVNCHALARGENAIEKLSPRREWVNDSGPEAEFQEMVNQSKAMLKAVALAETFSKTP